MVNAFGFQPSQPGSICTWVMNVWNGSIRSKDAVLKNGKENAWSNPFLLENLALQHKKLVMQKSCREPQSSETVCCFLKRKSCCHVITIPQAGIAAPTLTVMQGFQAKKDCSVHFLFHF